jgi:hypothetical protein
LPEARKAFFSLTELAKSGRFGLVSEFAVLAGSADF